MCAEASSVCRSNNQYCLGMCKWTDCRSEQHLRTQIWSQDCYGVLALAMKMDANCRSLSLHSHNFVLYFFVAAVAISTYVEHLFTSKDKQGRI